MSLLESYIINNTILFALLRRCEMGIHVIFSSYVYQNSINGSVRTEYDGIKIFCFITDWIHLTDMWYHNLDYDQHSSNKPSMKQTRGGGGQSFWKPMQLLFYISEKWQYLVAILWLRLRMMNFQGIFVIIIIL